MQRRAALGHAVAHEEARHAFQVFLRVVHHGITGACAEGAGRLRCSRRLQPVSLPFQQGKGKVRTSVHPQFDGEGEEVQGLPRIAALKRLKQTLSTIPGFDQQVK